MGYIKNDFMRRMACRCQDQGPNQRCRDAAKTGGQKAKFPIWMILNPGQRVPCIKERLAEIAQPFAVHLGLHDWSSWGQWGQLVEVEKLDNQLQHQQVLIGSRLG